MELWIRSQNKKILTKVDYLYLEVNYELEIIGGNHYMLNKCLGTYETKERALEVLDEIQRKLDYIYELSLRPRVLTTIEHKIVYEMPEE